MQYKPSHLSQLQKLFKSVPKPKSDLSFGPNLTQSRPLEMKGQIKKLIHYDCTIPPDGDEGDDIPEEDEVYIKENLLFQKRDDTNTDHDDDLSMVNINVSKLLSSSGSNSKNSITFNHSKETGSLSKQSNSNNNTFNKQLSPNNFNTSSSINSKKPATSGNNSVESSKSGQYKNSKRAITAKRKNIYEKLMKKNKIKLESKKKEQEDSQIIDENELKDIVNDVNFNYSTGENKSTNNANVKITNITNIIVNVKNIGTKSFDIKSMSTKTGKDIMMRDMKSLHLITQKALTAENPKLSSVDSFDDERTSFLNFRTNTKNELYIDDNTENKNIDSQKTPNSKLSQIINIININKNYSIKGNATPRVGKTSTYQHNYFCTEPGSINQGDSFRTAKTKSNKVIPIYRNHESNNSSSSISGRSLAVKDFINSIKNSKKTKKEKFITIGKLKK